MLAFLICFALLFMLGMYAPVWRTLWGELEQHYRDTGASAHEQSFSHLTCRVGGLPAELLVEICRAGLFLQLAWPSKWVAPAVLIPWQRLTLTNTVAASLLSREQAEFEVEHYPFRILIPGRAGQAVAACVRRRRT